MDFGDSRVWNSYAFKNLQKIRRHGTLEFPLFQQENLILDILGVWLITRFVTYPKTDWLQSQ